MFGYKDMTFCWDECENMKCHRNKKHIPDDLPEWMPIARSFFKGTKMCMEGEVKNVNE